MAPKKAAEKAEAAEAPPKAQGQAEKAESKPSKAEKKSSAGSEDPMPAKPNEEEYKKKLDAIKEGIDGKKDAMSKLSAQIDEQNAGKEEYEAARNALFEELNAVKADKDLLFTSRRDLQDREKKRRMEEKEMRGKMNSLEKTLQSEEDIDAEIQKIEHKISTTTMPLKEEKALMQQIKKLKAQRPEMQKNMRLYESMKARCAVGSSGSAADGTAAADSSEKAPALTVEEQIKKLSEEIDAKKTKHDAVKEKIGALKATREKDTSAVQDLVKKKKAIKEEVDKLLSERQEVQQEKRDKQRLFNDWEKRQRLQKQKEREAAWALEQAAWEAQRAQQELEKPNPYLNETTLLEQTIDYCKILLGEGGEKKEEEKKDIDFSNAEGHKVLVSKKDRQSEMYFEATKKKNLKKKNQGGDKKTIKHTADTFAIFDKLKVPAPMNVGDVTPLMEKLQKTLAEYNEKVSVWEADRKKKIEEAKNKASEEGGADPAAEEKAVAA